MAEINPLLLLLDSVTMEKDDKANAADKRAISARLAADSGCMRGPEFPGSTCNIISQQDDRQMSRKNWTLPAFPVTTVSLHGLRRKV